MKVFEYNVITGSRGKQVDTIAVPCALSNIEMSVCNKPKNISADSEWKVFTTATDKNNVEIKYAYPVCFCIGRMRCGTEPEYWSWVILLPKHNGELKF